MAGPLDPLISMLKSSFSSTSANPWKQILAKPDSMHDFKSHYQEDLAQGTPEPDAWTSALADHGRPSLDLKLSHLIKSLANPQRGKLPPISEFFNSLSTAQPTQDEKQVIENPDLYEISSGKPGDTGHFHAAAGAPPLTDSYIQTSRPNDTGERTTYLEQSRSKDFERSLPIFTPQAQAALAEIPKSDIQAYYENLRQHGHLDNTEVDTRQAMIYNLAKKAGKFDDKQFYQDVLQTSLTNPGVYTHILHHGIKYADVSPEDRALNIMAHVGAFFGSDIYHTPLGKYYEGIIDPAVGPNTGYAFDPTDTVWRDKSLEYLTPEQRKSYTNTAELDKLLRSLGVPEPDSEPRFRPMELDFPPDSANGPYYEDKWQDTREKANAKPFNGIHHK